MGANTTSWNFNRRISFFIASLFLFVSSPQIFAEDKILGEGVSSKDGTIVLPVYDFNVEDPAWVHVVAGQIGAALNDLGSDAVTYLVKAYADRGLTKEIL